MYNLRIQEAFEIRRHHSGTGKGLNEGKGAYVIGFWPLVLFEADVTPLPCLSLSD